MEVTVGTSDQRPECRLAPAADRLPRPRQYSKTRPQSRSNGFLGFAVGKQSCRNCALMFE